MDVIVDVFVIFAAAKAAGEIFVRLRQPAIVGELLVGVVLGPHVLGVVHVGAATDALGQLGIVILLFTAGLETRRSDLLAVGASALLASLAGMVVTAGAALVIVWAFGYPVPMAAIVAVALAPSSVGIAARVFGDLGVTTTRAARVVLGGAVVDDVVALALLPLVLGLGSERSVASVLVGLAGAVGFLVLVTAAGPRLARRHSGVLARPRIRRSPFVVALAICLGLAALAEQVGLAALVGAFLAGMVLAETRDQYDLERRMEPLFDFLVPFFFVTSAARLDPSALSEAGLVFLVLTVVGTILGKQVGCGVGAVGLSLHERLIVGAGMVPRAEVTLAIATAALEAGDIGRSLFSATLAAVLVTSLLAPALLKFLIPMRERRIRRRRPEAPPEASGRLEEDAS
jgi:Kef-type K+ transport system membrane component KefB